MKAKNSVDLSIVIAAHTEGLIAHKTILSVERAVEPLKKSGISYEILATLDRPDETTKRYFSKSRDVKMQAYEVDFGDLAASRNFGIQKSAGTYIALVDADDLVSENWFIKSIETLEATQKPLIVHTEYSVNFGTQSIVWRKFDSNTFDREALMNIQANQWDSAIVAPKSLLEQFPFQPNLNGFGPEDWHFNCQTLAAGIPHKIIPDTALFVRRKNISVMTVQRAERHTMHYTDLQSFERFRTIEISNILQPPGSATAKVNPRISRGKVFAKKSLRASYDFSRQVPILGQYVQKAGATFAVKRASALPLNLPDWLLAEWRAVHTLEKQLYPSRDILSQTAYYESAMYELGIFYWRLVQHTTRTADYLLFVPYLTRGGADLFAINYANTLAKDGYNVTVIATQDGSYEWSARLAKEVDFIPFGKLAEGMPKDAQLQVLIRFVIQSRAKTLHVLHSALAFDLVESYKTFFAKNGYTIFSNAFCDDVDNEGKVSGHIHTGLPRVYEQLTRIFADNSKVIAQLEKEYAFDSGRFTVHHQPVVVNKEILSWPEDQTYGNHYLWAGRIAKQKRPDLLLEIARQLQKDNITIDVYGSFQDGFNEEYLEQISNINYCGPFSSFLDLPYNNYAALLYTTERDGLPNLLLEAASVGMPAIAPNVGGVGDIVTPRTGILIADPEDVASYAQAVRKLTISPVKARELGQEAKELATKNYNPKVFASEVKKDIEPYIQHEKNT